MVRVGWRSRLQCNKRAIIATRKGNEEKEKSSGTHVSVFEKGCF